MILGCLFVFDSLRCEARAISLNYISFVIVVNLAALSGGPFLLW